MPTGAEVIENDLRFGKGVGQINHYSSVAEARVDKRRGQAQLMEVPKPGRN